MLAAVVGAKLSGHYLQMKINLKKLKRCQTIADSFRCFLANAAIFLLSIQIVHLCASKARSNLIGQCFPFKFWH